MTIDTLESKLLGNGMAPKGVEMVHNVIFGAYKYAVRMEVTWRNPAKSVTPPKVTRKEVEPPEIVKIEIGGGKKSTRYFPAST